MVFMMCMDAFISVSEDWLYIQILNMNSYIYLGFFLSIAYHPSDGKQSQLKVEIAI